MLQLKELEEMLFQGKLNRREFIAQVSALGLTAAMSPALLSTLAHASGPKKGGRLRIGCAGAQTSDSLDPITVSNLMTESLTWQLRNCLVEVDYKSNPVPELAESWEATPDAKKWIFKIRKGVEFHNGKTMDAEDVIFSINHHRGKDSKSPAKVIVDPVKEIKMEDKHTVAFMLEEGNADFPFLMSDYHLQIVPSGTTEFEKGVGTGGYMLVSFEPGVRSLTKRNPNYWKEGRAHFDEVETIGINDVNARTNAVKTGQIDVMTRCDVKTLHLLAKAPGIQVVETNGTKHYTIPMQTDISPYDNNDVRLALKYGIDREQMLKTILRGRGIIGNDHPISPANRYYASELPQREFDPDKAKFHLKKAGITDHTFKLHTADAAFPGAVDVAILYKEQAAKAGIKIEVVREPMDGYWDDVWRKKEWCFSYWWGRPTEDWMFSTTYATGASWNESDWKHEGFNKLLKEARSELDEKKRREMYFEMQKIVSDEGGSVIPLFPSDVMAATTKLKYENVAANIELDGLKLHERWWFES
jgi:peptide/nickel transport system substrate-binding protein